MLLRRAVDLHSALRLGIRIGLDEIGADEFASIQIIEEVRRTLDPELLRPDDGQADKRHCW